MCAKSKYLFLTTLQILQILCHEQRDEIIKSVMCHKRQTLEDVVKML